MSCVFISILNETFWNLVGFTVDTVVLGIPNIIRQIFWSNVVYFDVLSGGFVKFLSYCLLKNGTSSSCCAMPFFCSQER